jgi:hypothetical protein
MSNRLIINSRGETIKAIDLADGRVRLQVAALADSLTLTTRGATVEIEFSRQEAAALCLSLADAIDMACELTPRKI